MQYLLAPQEQMHCINDLYYYFLLNLQVAIQLQVASLPLGDLGQLHKLLSTNARETPYRPPSTQNPKYYQNSPPTMHTPESHPDPKTWSPPYPLFPVLHTAFPHPHTLFLWDLQGNVVIGEKTPTYYWMFVENMQVPRKSMPCPTYSVVED